MHVGSGKCFGNTNTIPGRNIGQHGIFFASIQCSCMGSTWNWLKVFTVKQISGRVFTRYITTQSIIGIGTGLLHQNMSLVLLLFVVIGVAMDLQSIIPNF
jgi:hypothetical protein